MEIKNLPNKVEQYCKSLKRYYYNFKDLTDKESDIIDLFIKDVKNFLIYELGVDKDE